MGTPEQRAHREAYLAKRQAAFDAAASGQWADDASLEKYLGRKSPLYNQLYSQGGFSRYGMSWDPAWQSDFEHNQEIPYGDPETQPWYDPSKPENWSNTDPIKAARMAGHFKFGDENADMINSRYGGNALAAFLNLRAKSNMPNSPDMRFWNEGNGKEIAGMGGTGTGTGTSTASNTGQDTNFWNWFYSDPGQNIKLFDSPLAGLPGFDASMWDKLFNRNPTGSAESANPQVVSGQPAAAPVPIQDPGIPGGFVSPERIGKAPTPETDPKYNPGPKPPAWGLPVGVTEKDIIAGRRSDGVPSTIPYEDPGVGTNPVAPPVKYSSSVSSPTPAPINAIQPWIGNPGMSAVAGKPTRTTNTVRSNPSAPAPFYPDRAPGLFMGDNSSYDTGLTDLPYNRTARPQKFRRPSTYPIMRY